MSEKILIIDDEQDIANLLEVYLKNENYIVYKFYCATDAMSCIESGDIDLAILDIMLPDMNGFSLCQLIRKKYTYPIIMLTAKIEETDKITGLTLGADDYVTKPFRPLEVVARVKAQLRRYKKYSPGIITEKVPSELSYNKLCLNVQTHECLLDGEPISLTPTEFSILHVLLSSAGNVVSIEELFHAVWKDEYYSKNSSTITVHIRHLREKLKDTSDTPQYIKRFGVLVTKFKRKEYAMKRKSNCFVTILFLIYLALLVWIILFKLQFSISDLDKIRSINFIPFHYDKEIGAAFHLTEGLDNFLIFVPMGIYLQMLLPGTKLYVKFMLIAGTSFLLETMQYILAVGRSDITDVLTNTAGGLLGLAVYSMTARLIGNRIKANRLFSILASIVSVVVIGLLGLILFANR